MRVSRGLRAALLVSVLVRPAVVPGSPKAPGPGAFVSVPRLERAMTSDAPRESGPPAVTR